jgi:hypothetical protein
MSGLGTVVTMLAVVALVGSALSVQIAQQYERGGVLFRDAERRRPSFRLAAMPQGLPTPTVAVIEAVDHKGVVTSASTTRPSGSLRGASGACPTAFTS